MKLKWTAYALADRDEIFDYIQKQNPVFAVSMDERIANSVKHLVDFPESGRTGRVPGTRELVVTGTPYIIAYIAAAGTIRILRVIHTSMSWPDIIG